MPLYQPIWYYLFFLAASLALVLLGIYIGRHTALFHALRQRLHPSRLDMDQLSALYDAQLFDRALELCDQALKRDPKDGEARFHRALALIQLDRFDEALGCLTSLVLQNPHDYRAMHQLSYTLFRSNLNYGALAWMEYIASHVSDDSAIQLSLADILSTLGQQSQAIQVYDKLKTPTDQEAEIALAWGKATCYARAGQEKEAIAQYQECLLAHCDDPECRLQMSQAQQRDGQLEEALQSVLGQILLTPDYGPLYIQAAKVLLSQQKPEQALSYLEQASQHDSAGSTDYDRACCLASLNRFDEAMDALKKVLHQETQSFRDFLSLHADQDFPLLKEDARFNQLIQ